MWISGHLLLTASLASACINYEQYAPFTMHVRVHRNPYVVTKVSQSVTAINGDARRKTKRETEDMDKKSVRLAQYPSEWDVEVPKGTKLEDLRMQGEQEVHTLPEKDLEDKSPLPAWFRVYFRKHHQNLPTSGPYQYPRTAARVLQWMLQHPNSPEITSK
jgi:hypothetical protein